MGKAFDLDTSVGEVLLKVAMAKEPFRYIVKPAKPKGKEAYAGTDFLIETKTGNNAKLLQALVNPHEELLKVEGDGEATTITLTELGREKLGDAVAREAKKIPVTEQEDFINEMGTRFPEALPSLMPVLEELSKEKLKEHTLQLKHIEERKAKKAKVDEAVRKYNERYIQETEKLIQFHLDALRTLGGKVEPLQGEHTNSKDAEQQNTVQDLWKTPPKDAANWKRYGVDQAVDVLEDAIESSMPDVIEAMDIFISRIEGMKAIGRKGEIHKFDPSLHKFVSSNMSGANVKIEMPGWTYLQEDGTKYIAFKALVTPGE